MHGEDIQSDYNGCGIVGPILLIPCLPRSPKYLVAKDQEPKARAILEVFYRKAKKIFPTDDLVPVEDSEGSRGQYSALSFVDQMRGYAQRFIALLHEISNCWHF